MEEEYRALHHSENGDTEIIKELTAVKQSYFVQVLCNSLLQNVSIQYYHLEVNNIQSIKLLYSLVLWTLIAQSV